MGRRVAWAWVLSGVLLHAGCGGGGRADEVDGGADAAPTDGHADGGDRDARTDDGGPAHDGGDAEPPPCSTETCGDGLDGDCDGTIDEHCPCDAKAKETQSCYSGPVETRGVGACSDGTMECQEGFEFGTWGECEGEVVPSEELCDSAGVDEDCDGAVDEGCECTGDEPIPCGSDVGACGSGVQQCIDGIRGECEGADGPSAESCNGIDDDCDGAVDEGLERTCGSDRGECSPGVQVCTEGEWGVCTGGTEPAEEQCDGLDNDCDGDVDEDLERSCGSDVGECSAGTQGCTDGSWSECSGSTGPTLEECDGLDNDCDGDVDEGLTRECGTDVGLCSAGTESCIDGGWGECDGAVGPEDELCDGAEDEDCDGAVDEGCICTEEETRACGSDTGECEAGLQECDGAGMWGTCDGAVGPSSEECDDLDNDCDGKVDEGDICPTSPPTVTCPGDESAEVLSTVSLSASGSDPDGGSVSYEWTVTARPTGSSSEPSDPSSASTDLYLDASGTYELRFCVTDDEDETACCEMTVESIAPGDIHWELSWSTEYGDVDIHLLDVSRTPPDGWWTTDDCHWRNENPDWGPAGADADPNLDIDDTDGYGPENITIDANPQEGTYHVAAHYFCERSLGSGSADGSGPTTATIRVYCGGDLVATYEDIELDATDAWVTVAQLEYPSCDGMSVDDRTWGSSVYPDGMTGTPHCEIPCDGDADCPPEEVCATVGGGGPPRQVCVLE